jgi:hypothetical protein
MDKIANLTDEDTNPFGNIISCYTWDDAVADGTNVPVTGLAKQWGFHIPVAITSNLFASHIRVGVEGKGEDERLTNNMIILLLVELRDAIKLSEDGNGTQLAFEITFDKEPVKLLATIEGRNPNNREPVMTIMLPEDM